MNWWRRYRGEPNVTLQELQGYYRTRPYAATPLQNIVPRARAFQGQPQVAAPLFPLPNTPVRQGFLDSPLVILDLPLTGDPTKWKGTRFLGKGGSALIGLWEYQDNADPKPPHRQVAVKQLKSKTPNPKDKDAALEQDFLKQLSQRGSPHIVRVLYDGTPIDGVDEALSNAWDGVTRRIFLEYCPLGSLQDLLKKRITEYVFTYV